MRLRSLQASVILYSALHRKLDGFPVLSTFTLKNKGAIEEPFSLNGSIKKL